MNSRNGFGLATLAGAFAFGIALMLTFGHARSEPAIGEHQVVMTVVVAQPSKEPVTGQYSYAKKKFPDESACKKAIDGLNDELLALENGKAFDPKTYKGDQPELEADTLNAFLQFYAQAQGAKVSVSVRCEPVPGQPV